MFERFLGSAGGFIGVCQNAVSGNRSKMGSERPKSVLPEGVVGMGMQSAPGGSRLSLADLYGPKDVRGHAGCPLGGPGLDFRAGNVKFVTSILEHFCGFCVSLRVHLEW